MKIKVYKKEHVAGIVLLQDDKIIGMIHSKFNKDFNSFEVKRVATTVTGLGEELYFLLSISLNGIFIIKDTVCSMPKAEYLWKKFVNSQVWDKVVFNNNILFRVKPTNFPEGLEIENYSFLDVDWFRSILLFKDSLISSLEKDRTNPSLPKPLSVVTRIQENND